MSHSFLTQSFDLGFNDEHNSSVPFTINVREGDIMKAKPKFFEPRPHGTV